MKKMYTVPLLAIILLLAISSFTTAVSLTEPVFGVANRSVFNVTTTTATGAECRYSSPFEKPFAEMAPFTQTDATSHRLLNFQLPETGLAYLFLVECSNAEKGSFYISVDASPPSLAGTASPGMVIEAPLNALLAVDTTENSTCRYDNQNNHYDTMRFSMDGSDNDKASYRNHHEAALTALNDKTDYNYGVMCRNLAGLLSGLVNVTFKVDTSVAPAITETIPKAGLTTTSLDVNLSVTTNKRSMCSYGNTSEARESGGNFSLATTNHNAAVTLKPGQYRYYFRCIFEGPKEVPSETVFSVDNTPPSALAINDLQDLKDVEDGFSYYLDRLEIRFSSEDNESGIDFYNYSIVEDATGKVVRGWAATDSSRVTARDLKLTDGEKYYVQAYAQNKAGLRTEVSRSRGVVVNPMLNEEYACSDRVMDGDESDVDCGGSCNVKCSNGKVCISNSDCRNNFCVSGTCRSGNCTDGYTNQEESDVDCGGSCARCDLGMKCRKAVDCASGVCTGGTCVAEGPCSNRALDAGESDVDCGGICAGVKGVKCSIGQKCVDGPDCRSGLCSPLGRCASSSDIDGDGIQNTADLCPEAPPAGQSKVHADLDGDKVGDDCDPDNDNDGMPDDWEKTHGLNRLSSGDALLDPDKDGLTNLKEFMIGTSPKNRDTDKDGSDDGKEVKAGTDPSDAKSKPKGRIASVATFLLVVIAAGVALLAAYSHLKKRKGRQEMKRNVEYSHPGQGHPHRAPPTAPPSNHYRARHDVFDELQRTYGQLSGDELFEHLRKKVYGRK